MSKIHELMPWNRPSSIFVRRGERKEKEKEDGKNYLRREISYGSFTRTVALPETADSAKIKAAFRNGILTIEVPKKPEAQQKPKKVEIKTAA